jgi:hypothetical protein
MVVHNVDVDAVGDRWGLARGVGTEIEQVKFVHDVDQVVDADDVDADEAGRELVWRQSHREVYGSNWHLQW